MNYQSFFNQQRFLKEFLECTTLDLETLNETLIQFGSQSSSQFGNVLILAGGGGSGKGFVLNNLIDLDGKVLDVDALKQAALRAPKIIQQVKDEFGTDLASLKLSNPDDVKKLHLILSDGLHLADRQQQALFASILTSDPSRKPNIIFDVTLKDLQKLYTISTNAHMLGYDNKKINIVWVLNDIEVAKQQNANRSRRVPEEILINTHEGVSMTMKTILDMGSALQRYMDGNIFVTFNKVNVDTQITKSDSGGKFLSKADYIQLKKAGSPQMSSNELSDAVLTKIRQYTPDTAKW
jgi:hypothetical protein